MKTHASEPLSKIEIIGDLIRIHLNEIAAVKEDYTDHCYDTVTVSIEADRGGIIEAIIGRFYSQGMELSLINNRDAKPAEYTAYQEFRAFAKTLADEVIAFRA